jgi:hypothetical protein
MKYQILLFGAFLRLIRFLSDETILVANNIILESFSKNMKNSKNSPKTINLLFYKILIHNMC